MALIAVASVVVVLLGLATLVCVIQSIRSAQAAQDRGPGLLLALVITASSIGTQTTLFNGSNAIIQGGSLALIAVTCLFILARSPNSAPRERLASSQPRPRFWVALVLWLWLFVVDVARNGDLQAFYVVSRLAAGIIWVPLLMATVRYRLHIRHFAYAIVICLSVSPLVGLVAQAPWLACQSNKCGVVGELYAGPFPQENFLGIQSNFGIFLSLLYLRGRARVFGASLCSVQLLLTVSRSSIYIVLIGIGTIGIMTFWKRVTRDLVTAAQRASRPGSLPARALLLVLPITSLGLYLVHGNNPEAFTGRGLIWIDGMNALGDQTPIGLGTDRWARLLAAGLVPDHFPHSEYLLLLFSGGYIAVVIWAAWVILCIVDCLRESGRIQDAGIHFAFLATGLTEIVWNPLTFDGLVWIAFAITLASYERPDPSEAARNSASDHGLAYAAVG